VSDTERQMFDYRLAVPNGNETRCCRLSAKRSRLARARTGRFDDAPYRRAVESIAIARGTRNVCRPTDI